MLTSQIESEHMTLHRKYSVVRLKTEFYIIALVVEASGTNRKLGRDCTLRKGRAY